jgi:hypothetical protein
MSSNFWLCSPAQQLLYTLAYVILYFVQQQVLELVTFLGYTRQLAFFFLSSHALLHTFISERDCTLLQCFYKGCFQSNEQLALSQLMHSMHCGSAVFPYQVLERRTAQQTFNRLYGIA